VRIKSAKPDRLAVGAILKQAGLSDRADPMMDEDRRTTGSMIRRLSSGFHHPGGYRE
jgi:hypothetical protein